MDAVNPDDALKVFSFAESVVKLKKALDQHEGVTLTAAEVDGIIWGIRTLRGSDDAAATS